MLGSYHRRAGAGWGVHISIKEIDKMINSKVGYPQP